MNINQKKCEAPRGRPRGIFAEPCEAKNAILSCHSSSGATEDPPCGKPQGILAKKGEFCASLAELGQALWLFKISL